MLKTLQLFSMFFKCLLNNSCIILSIMHLPTIHEQMMAENYSHCHYVAI